jgi:hypothetical protein
MIKISIILAALACVAATVTTPPAKASNPAYALQLTREAQRISSQIVRLATAGQHSGSIGEMCGYYVPRISAKVRRLRQIVRLLYVNTPSSMRYMVDTVSRSVTRSQALVNKSVRLCQLYG